MKKQKMPQECDTLCPYRSCYFPGENKGILTPGRGYTHYFEKPIPCCMTRLRHGCPSGPPDGDRATRPAPDWTVAAEELTKDLDGARVSQKVWRLINTLLSLLRAAGRYQRLEDLAREKKKEAGKE